MYKLFMMLHDWAFPPAKKIRAKALREAYRMLENYTMAHEECEAEIGKYQKRIARLESRLEAEREAACTP